MVVGKLCIYTNKPIIHTHIQLYIIDVTNQTKISKK